MTSALLCFALALAQCLSPVAALPGVPLDASQAKGLPVDAASSPDLDLLHNNPVAQLVAQQIGHSCLLVSPTDADRVQACVAMLTERMQLPDVVAVLLKDVPSLAAVPVLSRDVVRDLMQLSELKGADLDLLVEVVQAMYRHVIGIPLVYRVDQTRYGDALNLASRLYNMVIKTGLVPEEVTEILLNNLVVRAPVRVPNTPSVPFYSETSGLKVLDRLRGFNALNGLPSVPGFNGLPSVPGFNELPSVPGLSGLPSVPGLNGLPGVPGLNGLPGVPGLNGLPSVPGFNGLPSVPGLNGLPSVPGLNGLPSVPGLNGLPSVPGLNGLPSVPGLNGLPSVPGLPGLNLQDNSHLAQVYQVLNSAPSV